MLSAILHRKRSAAKALAATAQSIEEHRQVYGTRLLVRGLLWVSIYGLSRGLLALDAITAPPVRIVIALLPVPFFIWYLWTWFRGAAAMDDCSAASNWKHSASRFPRPSCA
jgi:hypothetical protein